MFENMEKRILSFVHFVTRELGNIKRNLGAFIKRIFIV